MDNIRTYSAYCYPENGGEDSSADEMEEESKKELTESLRQASLSTLIKHQVSTGTR